VFESGEVDYNRNVSTVLQAATQLGYTACPTSNGRITGMNLHQKVVISDQVISQEVMNETVLLDLQSECYFGLDAVGTRIWQLIREGKDLLGIHATLLEEYEVEESRLRADLEAIIKQACERGLISLADSA
jgi:hypothetical protein